jgi:glutathione-regulated potassium-efflux system ancillary protein KefG
MSRVLIAFAHPALQMSRVHARLLEALPRRPDITVNDLYDLYPAFDVDVPREQALLAAHDVLVLQHPLYWYSVPPLLKQWIDLVLEHGWAYGSSGTALRGKAVMSLVTAGGAAEAYGPEGFNRYTLSQLLAPVEQTFRLCGMDYLPPYAIHGTHRLTAPDIEREAGRYAAALEALADGRWDEARRAAPDAGAVRS